MRLVALVLVAFAGQAMRDACAGRACRCG